MKKVIFGIALYVAWCVFSYALLDTVYDDYQPMPGMADFENI